MPVFGAFTASVIERIQRVLGVHQPKLSKPAKTARRLERAGQHLVRAAHRTHGPAEYQTVSAYERNEAILQCPFTV
jgi:hypothetical protein